MIAMLAALGAGFDCASEAEMELVLNVGVTPEHIIYAHPCKPPNQVINMPPAALMLSQWMKWDT